MAFNLKTLAGGMFSRILLNSNFQSIQDKVNDDLLHRQGDGSSVMKKDLDMDSNEILNVPDPTTDGSVANKGYVDTQDAQYASLSQARDDVLQGNIDALRAHSDAEDATLKAYVDTQDVYYNRLANEYTDELVNSITGDLDLEGIGGELKTVRYSTVAEEGQSLFVVPFSGFKAAEVYINGVHQNGLAGAYTNNDSVFTFSDTLRKGDVVYFVLGLGFELGEKSNVQSEMFTATLGQTEFTLSSAAVEEEMLIFINGVKQAQDSYTVNLNTVIFGSGLEEEDLVEVIRINRIQKETEYLSPIALFARSIDSNTVIPENYNGLSVNPTVASGVTVTVPSGATWAIVGN